MKSNFILKRYGKKRNWRGQMFQPKRVKITGGQYSTQHGVAISAPRWYKKEKMVLVKIKDKALYINEACLRYISTEDEINNLVDNNQVKVSPTIQSFNSWINAGLSDIQDIWGVCVRQIIGMSIFFIFLLICFLYYAFTTSELHASMMTIVSAVGVICSFLSLSDQIISLNQLKKFNYYFKQLHLAHTKTVVKYIENKTSKLPKKPKSTKHVYQVKDLFSMAELIGILMERRLIHKQTQNLAKNTGDNSKVIKSLSTRSCNNQVQLNIVLRRIGVPPEYITPDMFIETNPVTLLITIYVKNIKL
jgi:hypothetical protein